MTRRITVATDGSCNCVTRKGGWAWVTDCYGSDSGPESDTTNNAMELTAILQALLAFPHPQPLHIQSDSMYSLDCITKWWKGWEAKGWVKRDGEPVKNKDLIQRIVVELKERDVTFEHVRGHRGHRLNEMADRLAGAAGRLA